MTLVAVLVRIYVITRHYRPWFWTVS